MANRKLPIGGVQTFSKVREEYNVYVDKTMHIYDIASRYNTVFLARPRRFGKSLLCSAIKSLFRAEKKLFEGLAIIETDWKWKAHPVIHLDLSTGDYTNNGSDNLVVNLNRQLKQTCESYNIKVEISDNIANNLALVIAELDKHIDKAVRCFDVDGSVTLRFKHGRLEALGKLGGVGGEERQPGGCFRGAGFVLVLRAGKAVLAADARAGLRLCAR